MYPILFSIGNFDIITYYFMIGIGIFAGFLTLYLNTQNYDQQKRKKIFLFAIIIFLPFILGARLGYFLECLIFNKQQCYLGIIGPSSLWFGLILSTLTAFFIASFLKLNVWEVADLFSLSISIGGFFVRFGCFFNGCCFGVPCSENFIFGTYFPYTSYPGKLFEDKPIHPTQLYMAFSWLFIFLFLQFYKKHIKFNGELIILLAFLFSISNFFVDFFRFHNVKIFLFSLSQLISLVIIIISILTYILLLKVNKKFDKF